MEFVQHETRSQIALATIQTANDDKPVYMSTTVPINNNINGNGIRPHKDDSFEPNNSDENDYDYQFKNFTSLPSRQPLDIQFKDVSYTVDLGFYKGLCFYSILC